jgi:hypothetical protein
MTYQLVRGTLIFGSRFFNRTVRLEAIRNIIFQYANLAVLIPLLIWFAVPRARTAGQKTILALLVLSAVTQLVSFIFWKLQKNNLPILHVYTMLECLVLLKLYAALLGAPGRNRVFLLVAVMFILLAVLEAILFGSIFEFNIYSRSIEALIIITLCLGWFIKAVSMEESEKERYKGISIINSGMLVYFAGAVTLFSYSSFITNMSFNARMNVWTMHTLLAFQLYILIAIGLWRSKAR